MTYNNLILTILNLLINLIDVLVVLLPVLLAVAFMTIIERKQLAAHQRRVGPNTTGYLIKYKKDSGLSIKVNCHRFIHTSLFLLAERADINKDVINALYKNRIAPIRLFDSEVVETCYDLTFTEQRLLFFNKFKNKGGIYLIQYKEDKSIYYIGRTINFNSKIAIHFQTKVRDKFHLFANLVGWSKFNFSIIEICDLNIQKER